MTLDNDKARELFNAARNLPSAEREPFLDKECGEDDALRVEVETLLDNCLTPTSFPTIEAVTQSPESYLPTEHRFQSGDRIGNFEIIKTLGEGGFGTVYLAKQHEPVERDVALKVLHANRCTEKFIRGFEEERQILAEMHHPGIAHFYDAGFTQFNQPYFVMEYVDGESITEYCNNNKLTIAQRLKLFAEVCKAVQHAHSKQVIHRDLTPNNILVSDDDGGSPRAQIIDFGISKSGHDAAEDVAGTLQYMSPEQATTEKRADAKSDIYTLGVVLYELLVGRPPLDAEMFKNVALHAQLKLVQEQDPPDASTKLSGLHDASLADSIASARQEKLESLIVKLRRELDWIPRKAMQKDPERRYETASEFAEDINKYLGGFPITAAPDSKSYRFRKTFRRNKGKFLSVATITIVLIAGLIFTLYFAIVAEQQREDAVDEKKIAIKQRRIAEEERDRTRIIVNLLAASAKLQSKVPLPGVVEDFDTQKFSSFEEVIEKCEDLFKENNSQLISGFESVADLLISSRKYDNAILLLNRVLDHHDSSDPQALKVRLKLGRTLRWAGKNEKAIEILEPLWTSMQPSGISSKDAVDTASELTWSYINVDDYEKIIIPAKFAFEGRRKLYEDENALPRVWAEIGFAQSIKFTEPKESIERLKNVITRLEDDLKVTNSQTQSALIWAKKEIVLTSLFLGPRHDNELEMRSYAEETERYYRTTYGVKNKEFYHSVVSRIFLDFSSKIEKINAGDQGWLEASEAVLKEASDFFGNDNYYGWQSNLLLVAVSMLTNRIDEAQMYAEKVLNNFPSSSLVSREDLREQFVNRGLIGDGNSEPKKQRFTFEDLPQFKEPIRIVDLEKIRQIVFKAKKDQDYSTVVDAFFLLHNALPVSGHIRNIYTVTEVYNNVMKDAGIAIRHLGFQARGQLYSFNDGLELDQNSNAIIIGELSQRELKELGSISLEEYNEGHDNTGSWILNIEYIDRKSRRNDKVKLSDLVRDPEKYGSQDQFDALIRLSLIHQLDGDLKAGRDRLCEAYTLSLLSGAKAQTQMFDRSSRIARRFLLLGQVIGQEENYKYYKVNCDDPSGYIKMQATDPEK